jgi:hypothetical protein
MKKLLILNQNEQHSKGLIVRIANAVIIAIVLFAATSQLVTAQAPRIPTPGAEGNFGDIQVDGDRVKILRVTDGGAPGKIRIKLSADGTWWKMLRAFDKNNRANYIEQENGRFVNKKDVFEIDSKDLNDTFKLEFWKAKLFGVHTHIMTETYRKLDFDGQVITFVWRQGLEDSDSDLSEDPTAPINESLKIDGKNVTIVSANGGRPGYATIKFQTDVDWWTALKFFDRNAGPKLIEKNAGKYQPATKTLEMPLGSLPSEVKLEFWTAKLLGVHTHMATKKLIRERFAGRIVTVTWGTPAAPINETVTIEGKKVTIKSSDGGTSGSVKFVFQTGLDWWTALKFFDGAGKARLIAKANGKYNPVNKTLTIPISSLPATTKLEFWTAKAFGVHTHMASKAITSERFDGRTITINWPK